MAGSGYSGTPLPRKLGLREGDRLALLHAPDGFDAVLGELPPAVEVLREADGALDVVVAFVTRRPALVPLARRLRSHVEPAGSLWIAWPKRRSGVPTDITEDVLREELLPLGLVDTKVCAIDETWSGLRFVIRRELR